MTANVKDCVVKTSVCVCVWRHLCAAPRGPLCVQASAEDALSFDRRRLQELTWMRELCSAMLERTIGDVTPCDFQARLLFVHARLDSTAPAAGTPSHVSRIASPLLAVLARCGRRHLRDATNCRDDVLQVWGLIAVGHACGE